MTARLPVTPEVALSAVSLSYGRVPLWQSNVTVSHLTVAFRLPGQLSCVFCSLSLCFCHSLCLFLIFWQALTPLSCTPQQLSWLPRSNSNIKEVRPVHFILGIQVHCRSKNSIFLSQCAYPRHCLACLGQASCKLSPTLISPNSQLCTMLPDHSPLLSFPFKYLQTVRSLMFAMLGTCSALAHIVGVLGGHATCLDLEQLAPVACFCRYIAGTLNFGIK